NKNGRRQVLWNQLRRCARGRQEMVRFVDQQPVRAARTCAQCGDLREQLQKELRTLLERQVLGVDDQVGAGLPQQSNDFVRRRRRLDVSNDDRVFEFIVVSLRIKHAELELIVRHSFGQSGRQRGLANARLSRTSTLPP